MVVGLPYRDMYKKSVISHLSPITREDHQPHEVYIQFEVRSSECGIARLAVDRIVLYDIQLFHTEHMVPQTFTVSLYDLSRDLAETCHG